MYRAVVGDELGPPTNYRLQAVEPKPLAPNEIRIAAKAAGVSFVDVLVAAGRYQALPAVPFTPGSECAGIVVETGASVRNFAVGDKVIATGWVGMFAECVTVSEDVAWPMPDTLSFAEGATFPVSYLTSWHALVDRGVLKPRESLLVLGAGGATGYAAIQIAAHLGAHVIASASSEEKRALAKAAGAHQVVDGGADDWRKAVIAANDGRPVDVVFDPVGGTMTELAFRTLGYGGRHLVVGFPGGIPALPANLTLLKEASLVGVNISAFSAALPQQAADHQKTILALAAQGVLKPAIGNVYPLEQFVAAMSDAQGGKGSGRIVLTMD